MKPTGATKEDNAITAFWATAATVGGCSNCKGRPEKVAMIRFSDETLRFCQPCLDSLWSISDSLLDEDRN